MNKSKFLGQVFTEYKDVSKMIDLYKGDILNSKILEPSFGNGAFLIRLLEKIIKKARQDKKSEKEIKKILEENIHGYEIDERFYSKAIENLNQKILDLKFNLKISWTNLKKESIFFLEKEKFDLIIGNPPYVRIQNFDKNLHKVKKSLLRTSGNTDLFLMFIDFLIDMLKEQGNLIFVVPNSFGKSKSAFELRKHMYKNGKILYIDFESNQLFSKVSVYSCIFRYIKKIDNLERKAKFKVGYDGHEQKIKGYDYFEPFSYNFKKIKVNLGVKNGIATLADKIFIFNLDNAPKIEKEFLIRIVKGSRQEDKKIAIFPYKIKNNKIVKFNSIVEIKKEAPLLYSYLTKNKLRLKNRSLESKDKWFEYGRSQAINDLMKPKFLINTIIKPNAEKLEIRKLPAKWLVYSGLYTTNMEFPKFNNNKLIKSLRFKSKDMRGNYKKISSSLLKFK